MQGYDVALPSIHHESPSSRIDVLVTLKITGSTISVP